MKLQWPTLKPETRQAIERELAVLDLILTPAYLRNGQELLKEVAIFLAAQPFGLKHSDTEKAAKIDAYATQLERFPIYAVKRTFDWWLRHGKKEPTLSQLCDDALIFMGKNVNGRRKMLAQMLKESLL
jgi:hypothetical protein